MLGVAMSTTPGSQWTNKTGLLGDLPPPQVPPQAAASIECSIRVSLHHICIVLSRTSVAKPPLVFIHLISLTDTRCTHPFTVHHLVQGFHPKIAFNQTPSPSPTDIHLQQTIDIITSLPPCHWTFWHP